MTLSVENNQSTGIMIPTIAAAAGGTVGGTVLAPAKYKSFEQLVDAAKDEVNFSEKTKDLKDDAKKAADTVESALNKVQEKLGKLNKDGLFTEGKAEVGKVLSELGAPAVEELNTIKSKGELADVIKAGEKDWANGMTIAADKLPQLTGEAKGVDVEQAKKLLPNGFELIEETVGEGDTAAKQYKVKLTTALQEVAQDAAEEAKTAAKEANDKIINAAREAVNTNVTAKQANAQFIAIADGATEGKVSKDAVEGVLKTAGEELQTAFNTIKKTLGKNRWLGAGIGVVGGLVAGLGIKAFIEGKKNA